MVDFNNETTVTKTADEIEKLCILERRYNLIEAFEDYLKKNYSGFDTETNIIRARLVSLYLNSSEIIKRNTEEKKLKELKTKIFKSTEADDLLEAISTINEILDKIKLTKVDYIKEYDETDIEQSNIRNVYSH